MASARSERSLAISADCKLSTARAEEPRASVDRAHAFAMCTSCACAALPAGRELRARAVSALCSTAHSHLIRAILHDTCAAHVSRHLGAVAPRLAAPGREHAQPPRGPHMQCKHQEPCPKGLIAFGSMFWLLHVRYPLRPSDRLQCVLAPNGRSERYSQYALLSAITPLKHGLLMYVTHVRLIIVSKYFIFQCFAIT